MQDDTILIKEVVISGKYNNPAPAGFKIVILDSACLSDYNHGTIADMLSENSSVLVKTYGSGGLATPSFRGTGPGHTRFTWNNINLNNPMPGQFDLSLVPAGFADNVQISYGGGSMDINSGGLGGIINIETKPEWDKKNIFSANPGFGSFGRYSGIVMIRTGNSHFQSVTKSFLKKAENNFPYINRLRGPDPVIEKRERSQLSQKAFIQEFYFKNSKSVVSTRIWYQTTSRNLPVPLSMLSENTGESQEDRSVRAVISYESLGIKPAFNISAAFLSDRLNYLNKLASIDSRNISRSMVVKADLMKTFYKNIVTKLYFDNELNIINSNNYTGKKARNLASLSVSAETKISKWLESRILVREILHDNEFITPDFSIGAEIKTFPGKDYFLKAGFSKNSRIPSLNDMYWYPGGNPDLNNENGYSTEIGWKMVQVNSSYLRTWSEITAFRNFINNMIQWIPGEYGYWQARNVNKITTAGVESEFNLDYSRSGFNTIFKVMYTFTRAAYSGSKSNESSSGFKQLMYIPANQINSVLKFRWKTFYAGLNSGYTGRRYIDAENSGYLPGYSVTDLNFGARISAGNTSYNINFLIENLFNISYQNIAWFPMPGRAFSLSLIFQLN